MHDSDAIFWPVTKLVEGYRSGALSPVEVTEEALGRIESLDDQLHSYLTITPDLALEQARAAERLYRQANSPLPPLLGVPLSNKDLFDVRGVPTTLGSRAYGGEPTRTDSEPVGLLRHAGAVFLGKTNTAEFGQSATTTNLLGPACRNPWDPTRTPGGSSGGAAASVAAGLASAALGSDGGGSIRIPAAMCGLVGVKPTFVPLPESASFQAMTEFVSSGPITRTVADARLLLSVLLQHPLPVSPKGTQRRIAWCPAPESRPIEREVRRCTDAAVRMLAQLGDTVDEVSLPLEGWMDAFGPLVLADEWRFRRHLLGTHRDQLTSYARKTIEAGAAVTEDEIAAARALGVELRRRLNALFGEYDLLVTPTTACVAFPIGQRPTEIEGEAVDPLWGAFPFTAPFNVSGLPAVTVPVGLAHGLPVGLQVIGPAHSEASMLDLCEELEAAVSFPADEMPKRWGGSHVHTPGRGGGHDVVVEHIDRIAVLRISRPSKRNALTKAALCRLQQVLATEADTDATAVVLTGGPDVFSAGFDLHELGRGLADLEVDEVIRETVTAIRELPIPVIAAIEGPCVGAAVEIAVACDARVASESAYFSLPATRLGLLYRPDGVAGLINSIGRLTVTRLLLLGEQIPATDAVAAGLASHVVNPGTALDVAFDLARGASSSTTEAVAATKQLIAEICADRSDLSCWNERRRSLLVAESRSRALASAKENIGSRREQSVPKQQFPRRAQESG